jgi:hypothetical protein
MLAGAVAMVLLVLSSRRARAREADTETYVLPQDLRGPPTTRAPDHDTPTVEQPRLPGPEA